MAKKENERQEKATEVTSGLQELARRRAELIVEFQAYMHVTSRELSLASDEETEALRSPLLAMKLTEEDISAWEKFRPLILQHLHSAQALHTRIHHLLTEAAESHLFDSSKLAALGAFFRSTTVGFQEKERGAQELAQRVSRKSTPHTDEHARTEKQEPSQEKDTVEKAQRGERQSAQGRTQEKHREKNAAKLPLQEPTRGKEHAPEESLSPLHTTRARTRWLIALLPPTIAPLYKAAVRQGSTVLSALQKTIEQSLVRQSFGIRSRDAILLTQEKLQNTEESLTTIRASSTQGDEAPTIILRPISLATQSSVVRSIHHPLLDDLLSLEQHGMRPQID